MAWICAACTGSNPEGTRFCGLCGARRAEPGDGAVDAASAPDASARVMPLVADAIRGLVPSAVGLQPGLREERRLVTALFADISGFSELTNRLDAEQLLDIIDPAVAALSDVVGRYGGVIEKFAGDALMALFGAPIAHDDDAVRALHVALDMHATLARLVPTLPADAAGLRLHVGVNSGHGIGRVIGSQVRFDYGVIGDVVVLAQRLEAAAPTGETYVGETTYELARKEFELESVGEIRVKGKDHAVRAWRLIGPRTRQGVGPTRGSGHGIVGRDPELRAISAFLARLDEGRGGAVFVVGEAGVGKTALCQAVQRLAASSRWEWLDARCLSYGAALAYWPISELMRRHFMADDGVVDPPAALRSGLSALGLEATMPFIAALCGIGDAAPTGLTPQTLQTRVHESVVAVLRALAARRPVVLHVEDLHWADAATIALLGDVLDASRGMPVLVLASSRPAGEGTVGELLAASPDSSMRTDLATLGPDAVAEIAAVILGGPADPAFVTSLLEHTGGNPFFVEEVTRALAERGALVPRSGRWQPAARWEDAHVPVTVEGVIGARVDSLTPFERDALEVLSVVGRHADLLLARAVSDGVDSALASLRTAGLLAPPEADDRYAVFHHPLTLQVVYSRLLRRRRADLHRAVGEAAERLLGVDDASIDLLARHFLLGEQPGKAFDYALRAAARAERLFANEQAAAYLRQALDTEQAATGAQASRSDLLLRRARVEEMRGAYEAALSLYDEALTLTAHVRAAAGKAGVLRKLGEYAASLDTIAATRAAQTDLTPEESAMLALEEGWVLSLIGYARRGLVVLHTGLARVSGRGIDIEAELLIQLARLEEFIGDVGAALAHAAEARRQLEAREDLPRLAQLLRILGGIQAGAPGPDGATTARATLLDALALARRVGSAEEEGAALVNLAQVLADLGEIDDAIRCDRESAAAFERVGLKAGVACALCNLADHLAIARRWDESLAAAEDGVRIAREIGNVFWITGALLGIGAGRLELGDLDGARAAADEVLEVATAHRLDDRLAAGLRLAAALRRRDGDAAGADELLARARAADPRPTGERSSEPPVNS